MDHWRAYYQYGDSERYSLNIKARKFTPTNLRELYRWKNGMTLEGSGTKEKSLEKKITSKTKKNAQIRGKLSINAMTLFTYVNPFYGNN